MIRHSYKIVILRTDLFLNVKKPILLLLYLVNFNLGYSFKPISKRDFFKI